MDVSPHYPIYHVLVAPSQRFNGGCGDDYKLVNGVSHLSRQFEEWEWLGIFVWLGW